MDATWGLTWSCRWHRIDPDQAANCLHRGVAVSLCGTPLYTQAEICEAKPGLTHLKVIVAEPEKAAGICKKCEKKAGAR